MANGRKIAPRTGNGAPAVPAGKTAESGQSILEMMLCFFFFFFFLLAILDIFLMGSTRMMSDYASYIAARARSLGYNDSVIDKKTRLATAGVAGKDISAHPAPPLADWYDVNERAYDYSRWGTDSSSTSGVFGVMFKYWSGYNNKTDTWLNVSTSENIDTSYSNNSFVSSEVKFVNYPFLPYDPAGKYFVKSDDAQTYNPTAGTVDLQDHAQAYLEP